MARLVPRGATLEMLALLGPGAEMTVRIPDVAFGRPNLNLDAPWLEPTPWLVKPVRDDAAPSLLSVLIP